MDYPYGICVGNSSIRAINLSLTAPGTGGNNSIKLQLSAAEHGHRIYTGSGMCRENLSPSLSLWMDMQSFCPEAHKLKLRIK